MNQGKKLLIFDLDSTFNANSLTGNSKQRQIIIDMLFNAHLKKYKIVVISSKILESYYNEYFKPSNLEVPENQIKKTEIDILTNGIDKTILNAVIGIFGGFSFNTNMVDLKNNKGINKWFYYNTKEYLDKLFENVNRVVDNYQRRINNPREQDEEKQRLRNKITLIQNEFQDAKHRPTYANLIKMFQIQEICNNNNIMMWENVFFFDSSVLTLKTFKFWGKINNYFNSIHFYGGTNKNVFDENEYFNASRLEMCNHKLISSNLCP